jgi:hypothetical protein
MVNATPRSLYNQEKNPVSTAQEAGWAPGPVWRDAENLAPPGSDPRSVQPVACRYTDYAILGPVSWKPPPPEHDVRRADRQNKL